MGCFIISDYKKFYRRGAESVEIRRVFKYIFGFSPRSLRLCGDMFE